MMGPRISIAVLNYRRPKNVASIIEALRAQTVPVRIIVWDNAPDTCANSDNSDNSEDTIKGADLVVRASSNLFCWPRWFLLAQSPTEFAMTMDDDIGLARPSSIEEILGCLETLRHQREILGPEGVVLESGQPYLPDRPGRVARANLEAGARACQHVAGTREDVSVDVVKGRSMAMRTAALRTLPMFLEHSDVCDDIGVCAQLRAGPRSHRVPGAFHDVFVDLPDKNGAMALSKREDWKQVREAARRTHFESAIP